MTGASRIAAMILGCLRPQFGQCRMWTSNVRLHGRVHADAACSGLGLLGVALGVALDDGSLGGLCAHPPALSHHPHLQPALGIRTP